MTRTIRLFILFEAAAFIAAALTHAGVLVKNFEHRQARVAESVIAGVLLVGLLLTQVRPAWTRTIGVSVQTFALFGTLVGLFTIAMGIGPRTAPDVIYHAVIITVLIVGVLAAARART